ncbi:MAG: HAD-IB family phosphatase [Deltaproteobacteria bacterium]|uniref:phosphoserine phosphatase n=1 Tax=Candidatus Zymogenus saltonus TaxID=2844893 RepID=A0A9D8PN72_9DELT|nr:HAD-IB family phosphatase [Candidatus Zymogenus saltonus]
MRYKAVALDVCGVLTTEKSVWQYIHERLGLWAGNAEKFQEDFFAGLISYREFCERDALLWAGIRAARMEEMVMELPYRDGIGELFDRIGASGLVAGLISTGLTLLTDRIAGDFGVDFSVANRLVLEDGVFTGGVEIAVGHDEKGTALVRFADSMGIDPAEVIAVGDGPSDIPMFVEAGFSVGFGNVSEDVAAASDLVIGESLFELSEIIGKLSP